MKYGATPLIRRLGPKRRTSGATPFGPSVLGGVPWAGFARPGGVLGRPGDHAATLLALPAPCVLKRLRITYSTIARLMPQPAPSPRAVLRSLTPKTPFPTPWVNTCVPAPSASA